MTATAETKPGAPKPMPFAIMRNGHEVIRGAMTDVANALENDDFDTAKAIWEKLHLFDDIHKKMEEGRTEEGVSPIGVFRLLDGKCNGVAQDGDLRGHHDRLYEYEDDVDDCFKTKQISKVKEIYPIFHEENLKHLKAEEDVMMPSVQKLSKSGAPMKKFIMEEVMPLIPKKHLEFFIKFANEVLERHDNGPNPKVRVFDHALWAVAKPEQWTEWDAWIRETLSESKYEEVQTAIKAWKEEQQKKTEQPVAAAEDKSADEPAAKTAETEAAATPESAACCAIL